MSHLKKKVVQIIYAGMLWVSLLHTNILSLYRATLCLCAGVHLLDVYVLVL